MFSLGGLGLPYISQVNLLQQPHELIHAQASLPDDRSQRTSIQDSMVRYNNLSKGLIAAQNQMAACLPLLIETCSFKRTNTLAP